MKKALIVGIDFYEHISSLYGCSNDALSLASVLGEHYNSEKNFDINTITASSLEQAISKNELKSLTKELFKEENEIALFFFAGHGYIEECGGYLVTSECQHGDSGFPLDELMQIVDHSPAKSKIVIIDSCHSGTAGSSSLDRNKSVLSDGVTILTASSPDQYANEENGSGIFTSLLVEALGGAASNLVGEVSPGGVYAHIDQSLGSWKQRPIFKTNVRNFTTLRKVKPPIDLDDLKQITNFFGQEDEEYQLDPTFEPERNGGESEGTPSPSRENTEKFAVLQKYNRVNLLVPVNAPHMWHAAMESKSCKLTTLGKHYWKLVRNKNI